MSFLNHWFSKTHNQKPCERPVEDFNDPRFAAKALMAWAMTNATKGPVSPADREIVVKFFAVRGYQPSRKISEQEFLSYSPAKQQVCYALDGVAEHGTVIGNTAERLRFLEETGRVEDPVTAKIEHEDDLAHYRP